MSLRRARGATLPRIAAAAAAALTGASLLLAPTFAGASPGTGSPDAPEIVGADAPTAVPGEYIVVLKPQSQYGAADDIASALTDTVGGEVVDVFNSVIDGYSAKLTEEAALQVAADERVEFVEQVQTFEALGEQAPTPNWGDDRIDQRDLPLDGRFRYPDSAGEGVSVYVLDSGIRLTHEEFAGRIRPGFDAVTAGGDASDCNGHGTHVAGTAVGTTYGVAKKATVYPVRILDCRGQGSSVAILAGIEWVLENAQKPAIANYSVGCKTPCDSPAIDRAVNSLIASGVTWVQAAGNSNDDACLYSPQKVAAGITVGNSTRTDAKAASSSHGRCLDLWAPGTEIASAWFTGDASAVLSTGTSMASPHVAGTGALYLAENPAATPAQVHAAIVDNATPGKITGLTAGSPNRLLFAGFLNGTTTPAPTPVELAAIADQTATVGTAVDLQAAATGGTAPYVFSAQGLPAGVTIDASTGRISGTPTTAGTATVTVAVRDSAATPTTDSVSFRWVVSPPPSTCSGTTLGTGTLTSGQQVATAQFTRTTASTIEACLDGPDGADFDLSLQKRSTFGWSTVARAATKASDETLSYSATAGTYRLILRASTGSGAYTATVK